MNADTPITLSYPGSSAPDHETTWAEFVAHNADAPEMLADVERRIAENNYAEVGGGAAPVIWVFA